MRSQRAPDRLVRMPSAFRLPAARSVAPPGSRAAVVSNRILAQTRERAKHVGSRVAREAGALARRVRGRQGSLGDTIAEQIGPMEAAFAAGLADETELGHKIKEWSGGLVGPSDLLFVASVASRALRLDGKFKHLQRINTAYLRQQVIHYARSAGGRTPRAFSTFLASTHPGQPGQAPQMGAHHGGKGAAAPAVSGVGDTEREPIPGARTEA